MFRRSFPFTAISNKLGQRSMIRQLALCRCWRIRWTLACSICRLHVSRVTLARDRLADPLSLLCAVMEQMAPTFIITGNSSNEKLIEAIIAYCTSQRIGVTLEVDVLWADEGDEHDECQYHVRPPKEYNLSAALSRLSHLRITRECNRPRQGSVGSEVDSAEEKPRWDADDMQTPDIDDERARKLTMLRLGCFTSLEAQLSVCSIRSSRHVAPS